MTNLFRDAYGRPILENDWVSFPKKSCNAVDIAIGKVVGFTSKQVKIKELSFDYSISKNELVWKDPDYMEDEYTTTRKPDKLIVLKYNPEDLFDKKYLSNID